MGMLIRVMIGLQLTCLAVGRHSLYSQNRTPNDKNVDECMSGTHDCSSDALCFNTRRAYRCRCKHGFYGNGKICEDENECEFENGGCVHFCNNSHGNYSCSCQPGFTLHKDGHNCIDIDECLVGNVGCQRRCVNTLGSYHCACNHGENINTDGSTCSSSGWCRQQRGCEHHCTQSGQDWDCACREGYTLHSQGKRCIESCYVGNGGCQHHCEDGEDATACSCHAKYMLNQDEKSCTATCGVNNGGCERRCKDGASGPTCSCPAGYTLLLEDRTSCQDNDECSVSNGGCSHACVNTLGSYECICPRGFKVEHDQHTCSDVDECDVEDTCEHNCINVPGSFYCVCRTGFQLYAATRCADQDECSINNGGCEHECENWEGAYQCQCRQGYKLHTNNKDCAALQCQLFPALAKSSVQCDSEGQNQLCTFTCQKQAVITRGNEDLLQTKQDYRCGQTTGFDWKQQDNTTLPACSESIAVPVIRCLARFEMKMSKCSLRRPHRQTFIEDLRNNLALVFQESPRLHCSELCYITNIRLSCSASRRKSRHRSRDKMDNGAPPRLVRIEFELQIAPESLSAGCDVMCMKDRSERRLKKTLKLLRKKINRQTFTISPSDEEYFNIYGVSKKTLKTSRLSDLCSRGHVLINSRCVGCSLGTYYDREEGACQYCPRGTYQDKEAEMSCSICPHQKVAVGLPGATDASMCDAQCEPGHYSASGEKPCTACPQGSYQMQHGRTSCQLCGNGISTDTAAATSFKNCQVREQCHAGHLYNLTLNTCIPCPRNFYQEVPGQDYCERCPGNTTTDVTAATNSSYCKDRQCGGHLGKFQGFIQSPNWPGDYPHDVECLWTIAPQKGRRILVVIPEIFLASRDKCGDKLVMRKSSSPYSLTSYESCTSTETSIAFTSRSKRLWIQFKTNSENSAGGFRIPYVTYNEEYQDLIEDIVRDGRLYSSHIHQEVLKDRQLLSALLEVIAQPYNYFLKYANVSRVMFPDSFIRLLTPKVRRFFSP